MISLSDTTIKGWTKYGRTDLFTKRQLQVMIGISQGLFTKEIAAELGVHVRTVDKQKQLLYKKLGVGCAVDAIRKALELGIIGDDWWMNND